MGATLNLVPRALSLALEPKPGKRALGTRLGYAKRMDEGGVCPSIRPHFAFGQFGKVVQVPCGQKKKKVYAWSNLRAESHSRFF